MGEPAPAGPLLGDELAWAIELLTEKQLRAYRYRREGQALNWIARRIGVSRARIIHLIAAAEKRLGYTPTVTPKRRAAYKPAAQRRQERAPAWEAYVRELAGQLQPVERRRLERIFDTAKTDAELERRLRQRLHVLERRRRKRGRRDLPAGAEHDDDYSRAVGEDAAEFAAELEADFGVNPMTGEPMGAADFVEDDGKGHDRL